MIPALFPIIGSIGGKLIDALGDYFPSDKEKQEAKLKLFEIQQAGQFREMETQMSAIIAEAKSSDKWTSRARPGFLYVVYIYLLAGIPMGIISAFQPEIATNIATGMRLWLGAIPDVVWGAFTAGYLGYAGFRTLDKQNILKNQ